MSPFGLFTASRAVSWAGSSLSLVALPVLAHQLTGDPVVVGLLAACEGLPYLVLGLPAGALVDRWGARPTMLVTTALSAPVVGSVPVAEHLGALSTPHLLLVALTTSTLFVFFDAGSFGAVPAIVGREHLGPATARLAGVGTLIGLGGPALAGVLLVVVPPAQVLLLDAASYGLSVLLLLPVRWSTRTGAVDGGGRVGEGAGLGAEIAVGLRYLWRQDTIRVLTLVGVGGSLAGGAVTGLLVVLADQRFAVAAGDARLGLLYAAGPAGALLATLLLTGLQRRCGVGRLSLLAWGAGTAALLVVAAAPTWWVAAAGLLVWQAAATTAILHAVVVRQVLTPTALQSRVNTTARTIAWGGQPLGAAAAGVLTAAAGPGAGLGLAVVCSAGAVLGGLAGGLRRTPALGALVAGQQSPPLGAPR